MFTWKLSTIAVGAPYSLSVYRRNRFIILFKI